MERGAAQRYNSACKSAAMDYTRWNLEVATLAVEGEAVVGGKQIYVPALIWGTFSAGKCHPERILFLFFFFLH